MKQKNLANLAIIIVLGLTALLAGCKGTSASRAAWMVSTFAGTGRGGTTSGAGNVAQFGTPRGMAVDSLGNIYVADSGNNLIRKITPAGVVSTLAGKILPPGTKIGGRDNEKDGDGFNFGSVGLAGYTNGPATLVANGDATTRVAQFHSPKGVAVDSSGNVYVADSVNNCIRKITIATDGTATVSTFAGLGPNTVNPNYDIDTVEANRGISTLDDVGTKSDDDSLSGWGLGTTDGPAAAARFQFPRGVAVDSSDNVYVADSGNHRIRKITVASDGSATVSTLTNAGFSQNPVVDDVARFYGPRSLAVDSDDNIYVADWGHHRIQKITPAGDISTLAGIIKSPGYTDGSDNVAQFNWPYGVAVDSSGNVYVADHINHRIRKITPAGVVSTLAGTGKSGFANGDASTTAKFENPMGVAVNPSGSIIYVADTDNYRIRKIEFK